MTENFVPDAPLDEDDLQDAYREGLLAGLHMAQEMIASQIECLYLTQQ